MCEAWKDDLKSMMLRGKDHCSLTLLPVSTLFEMSDFPLANATLLG